MLVLSHAWLLLLIPLPLLLRRWLPAYREERRALRLPWFQRIARISGQDPHRDSGVMRTPRWQGLALLLLWSLLVLAMARPQMLEPPISKTLPTRDLLLLVDLSGSMETEDFTDPEGKRVSRLEAVKQVLDAFLGRREGDRVGLILFGNAAFVQVPFTQDLQVARLLLQEAQVRMAGPRTAFGDAIGLAITLFERSQMQQRLIIALTDGNDTGSRLPPSEAARVARDKGIQIHVVGVGDPESVGEEAFDLRALEDVANTTGGRYFHAEDRDRLQEIYAELDRLDTREVETLSHQPRTDLYHWPLAVFLLLGLVVQMLSLRARNRAALGDD
jgi:Ca-activated chloride channel family protein